MSKKIKIISVEIQNFLSIREQEIKLRQGLFLITGENQDQFGSNGAGKSTIIEAIVWGLYGKTVRGTDEVMNRLGDGDCKVKIKMKTRGITYEVVRVKSRKRVTSVSLFSGGEDISLGTNIATQAMIESKILVKDYNTFISSNVFTSNSKSYCDMTDKEAKKFFSSVFNLNWFEKMASMAKEYVRKADNEILKHRSALETYKNLKAGNEIKLAELSKVDLSDLKIELKCIQNESASHSKMMEQYKSGVLDNFHQEYAKLQELKLSKMDEAFKVLKVFDVDYENLNGKRQRLNEERSRVKSSIELLVSRTSNNLCKRCGYPSTITQDEYEEATKKLGILRQQEKKFDTEIRELLHQIEKLNESRQQTKDFYAAEDLKHQAKLKESKDKYDLSKGQYDEYQKTYGELQSKETEVRRKLDQHQDAVKFVENAILDITEREAKSAKSLEETQSKKERLEIVEKGFDRGGMPSIIMDLFTKPLNKMVNDNLKKLGVKSFVVDFSVKKELKSGEVRDSFNISVIDLETKRKTSYSNFSGGEKKRIDVAIIISLLDLSIKNSDISILVLDEIIEATDIEGATAIVSMLEDVAESRTVFLITHNNSVKNLIDNRIHCIKKDGNTEVRYES